MLILVTYDVSTVEKAGVRRLRGAEVGQLNGELVALGRQTLKLAGQRRHLLRRQ